MNSRCLRIVIFAKAPLPGFAKTRLIPRLGARGAAQLAHKMLCHTLQQAVRAKLGAVELCVTPDSDDVFWQKFALPPQVLLTSQGPGDLGERLARMARRAISAGDSVLLIGTDCPGLDAERLRAAAGVLENEDAVLYPTRDGGYALLGLNRFYPALFAGVAWSTEQVAAQTRQRLRECNMGFQCLETLSDIDEAEDLKFLPREWRENL